MSAPNQPAGICPLCGESNECSLATNQLRKPVPVEESSDIEQKKRSQECFNCWCSNIKLTQGIRDLLSSKTNGRQCLCQRCLTRLKQDHS